jgi:hypothetical protein
MSRILGTIQPRRGNADEWATVNPTLAPGEVGYELDTGRVKRGNGRDDWDTLPYQDAGGGGGAATAAPYDLNLIVFGKDTVRAPGAGDNPFGVQLQRDVTFTSLTLRCLTADGSGSGGAILLRNGSVAQAVTMDSAQQAAGITVTGSWPFQAGDILKVQLSSVGATPGKGLVADLAGAST